VGLQFSVGEEAERAKDELREIFLTKTAGQWMELLGPAGLCVAPVLPLMESLDHPQARHRNVILSAETNGVNLRQLNSPIKGSGMDEPRAEYGPGLGEHNTEVFRDIGMDPEEIIKLQESGAFTP